MKTQTFYLRLTTLTPLHIGCGEVYEPISFFVDEATHELVGFDVSHFLGLLNEEIREKFSALCKKGTIESILEIMKFIRNQACSMKIEELSQYRIPTSEAFVEHYKRTLDISTHRRGDVRRGLNQFQVMRTAFDSMTSWVYIPGSAVKGSIRTAVCNHRNEKRSHPKFHGKNAGRELEQHLLGYEMRHFEKDPFRLVKLSDFFPINNGAKRRILYAVDVKKGLRSQETRAPYQIMEVVEEGAAFVGTMTVVSESSQRPVVENPVTSEEIFQGLKGFYGEEKRREDRELKEIGVQPLSFVKEEEDYLPLRVGRHSGAECVTVEGHRNIMIRRGQDKTWLDHATTIWLASPSSRPGDRRGLRPFGWVRLEILDQEEGKRLQEELHKRRLDQFNRQVARQEELAQARAERMARLANKRAKEKARAEKMAALREKWDAMSDEEKAISIVKGEEIAKLMAPGKDPMEFWSTLEQAEGQIKKDIAEAYRGIWEGNPRRWRKSGCSPKQWKKVETVVEILGIEHPDIQGGEGASAGEDELIQKIDSLRDWGEYKASGIRIEELPLDAAKRLRKRFKEDWQCDKRKARKEKKAAWKALVRHINNLKRIPLK